MSEITNQQELYRAIGRIEGKLKAMCEDVKDHKDRINTLETSVANMRGKATVAGAVAGFVGGLIIALLSIFRSK